MATPRIDEARGHAAVLTEAGVPTFVDPRQARANLPAVLVLPPRVTFDRLNGDASPEWRLVALAHPPNGLDAWAALDDLVERVAEVVVVASAEPGAYSLTPAEDPLPAYIITAATE